MKKVADSYDRTIREGSKGIDLYENLPEEITSHPSYMHLRKGGNLGSGNPAIREFLDPKPGERFLDLGCAANLLNYRLNEWPSKYFGVDASPATIELLKNYAKANGIEVGGLHLGPVDRLPYADGFFDMAACVGVLEYHPAEYAARVVREIARVLKPGGLCFLDVPNLRHPGTEAMLLMEEHMGRPIVFQADRPEFEEMLKGSLRVLRVDESEAMSQYRLLRV